MPTDLMHDPRISDLDVLRAAQAILIEDGLPNTAALLNGPIAARDRGAVMAPAAAPADQAAKLKHYLLVVVGAVGPELLGTFDSDEDRLEAARGYRKYRDDEDGLYRLDANGAVTTRAFAGGELDVPDVVTDTIIAAAEHVEDMVDDLIRVFSPDPYRRQPLTWPAAGVSRRQLAECRASALTLASAIAAHLASTTRTGDRVPGRVAAEAE